MDTLLPLGFIIVIVLLLCYTGGKMAESSGRSFWMGVLLVLFLNIAGLVVIAFINNKKAKNSFNPDFYHYKNQKIETIKQLAKMHEKGRLNDEEFEHMKKEIMKNK